MTCSDAEDFEAMLGQFGLTATIVRRLSEMPDDQIPFPGGEHKAVVGCSSIEGQGLMAAVAIEPGEWVAPARINGRRTPAGRYTNHAKVPNAKMIELDHGDLGIVALAHIEPGAEITTDYRDNARVNFASVRRCSAGDVTDAMVRDGVLAAMQALAAR